MKNNIHSEWITANAGSGKTTNLTARVLRLLLLGVPAERIVCLTYTKAAAAEMRSRVLDRLRDLLLMDDAACRAKLTEYIGEKPTDAQVAHARGLFGTVLDSPSGGLQLTTIHGFCQNILRRFPMEAGIAPHFTVLEETAADEVLRSAKHALLTGLEDADEWLQAALSLIGARGGETRFDALVADSIAKRRMWDEIWRAQSPASLRAHMFAAHNLAQNATQAALDAALCSLPNAADVATLRGFLPALVTHKTKSYRELGEGLAEWLAADEAQRSSHLPAWVNLFVKDDGERRKRMLNEKEYPAGHPLRETLEHLAESIVRYAEQSAALACAEESFAVAILAKALLDLYAAAKLERHALDYDDLINHTLALVREPETLGWVMSKLDHRIDHLLIDEAQDNSGAQWALAQVLVEELIASNDGVGAGNVPRSLLVVGDEKQSIYSFQGAAPEQFDRFYGVFTDMLLGSPSPLGTRALTHSYRSAEAVLKLVDTVCAQPEMATALSMRGTVHPHQLVHADRAGAVVLHAPIIAPEKITAPPMVIPTEYTQKASAAQLLAEYIAGEVAGWLAADASLAPGDILILVHRRKPMVAPLIRALQRRNVPVAGIDRLLLAEHLAVRDLLALMAWCANTADDLALAQVLRSPIIGMSDEELRGFAYGRPGSLWQAVNHPWLREVLHWREDSPYDFLTRVLEVAKKRRDFARRFGEEVHEVLDELKLQAAAMPAGMLPNLTPFAAWIAGSTRSIKREQEGENPQQLRIMTVHGAKGLEAKCVVLADTVSVPTTQHERVFALRTAHGQLLPVLAISEQAKPAARLADAKQAKKNLLEAEYKRLLYVALTRARDTLHVFGTASKAGEVKAGSWYEPVRSALCALDAAEIDNRLELRDARPASVAKKAAPPARKAAPLPAWAMHAPAAEVASPGAAPLAPSRLVGQAQAQPYAAQAGGDAKARGVRIHRVLELLTAHSTVDSIAQLVAHLAPDWSAPEQAKVTQEIAALFTQESWLWQHPRFAEASIAGSITHAGAQIPVSGQMDLLIETPDAVVIVDYKTGAAVPQSPAQVPLPYLLQLKIYHALVAPLYPARPVRCAIVWTSVPSVMWLDEQVESTAFVQAIAL